MKIEVAVRCEDGRKKRASEVYWTRRAQGGICLPAAQRCSGARRDCKCAAMILIAHAASSKSRRWRGCWSVYSDDYECMQDVRWAPLLRQRLW